MKDTKTEITIKVIVMNLYIYLSDPLFVNNVRNIYCFKLIEIAY